MASVGVTETGTRARRPDATGFATSADGLRLGGEIHGGGEPTIVFMPPNPISHSRLWKGQVHHLARHHRVVTYEGRGNRAAGHPHPGGTGPARGRGPRPPPPPAPAGTGLDRWRPDDCLAGMDATATGAAVIPGVCGDG